MVSEERPFASIAGSEFTDEISYTHIDNSSSIEKGYYYDKTYRYFIFIFQCSGEILIDDRKYQLKDGVILTIPVNHFFCFQNITEIDAFVISVNDIYWREKMVNVINPPGSSFWESYSVPGYNDHFSHPGCSKRLSRFRSDFMNAYRRFGLGCDYIVLGYIQLLSCDEDLPHAVANRKVSNKILSAEHKFFYKFLHLVEQYYTKHLRVSDYSKKIGVNKGKLSDICQDHSSKTPLEIIHDRLILEMKRYLIYTDLSVSEISYRLGYEDNAYFARFFRKKTGYSPKDYRNKYFRLIN